MALFIINNQKLSAISQVEVKLERDIQQLIESNLESIFGLKLVSSEFELNGLRIDTLAFDPETQSFVIVEYKRDRSSSVVDQGYAYLALMLNKKADFVLEYKEKVDNSLKLNEVDWSAIRIMFIASRFTTHQLGAINFKDLPIELWESRLYEGNILSLEQKSADSNAASIRTIERTGANAQTNAVQAEVKTYSINDVLQPETPSKLIYDELMEAVRSFDSDISEYARKGYIGIKLQSDTRTIFFINPRSNGIRIELNHTQPSDLVDPDNKVTYVNSSLEHKNRHMSYMLLTSQEDIEYAVSIMRQVYKRHTTNLKNQH